MKSKSIILFDGVCNLCNSSVQFVLKNENGNKLFFSSLQSEFAQNFLKQKKYNLVNFDTILLIENGVIYQKSEAIFKICTYLKKPFSLLYFFIYLPKWFRDYFYSYISKNRINWFGQSATCSIPNQKDLERFM